MQQLVSALLDRWVNKPILVIGGGPSVTADLARLDIEPACVISANEHGFHQKKFHVDLVVNVDKVHCMLKQPMQDVLRPHGAPIVNRHSWADYRLPDWRFAGNTGLTAVALAAVLGGAPVIVTGIDMWHGGRQYFHKVPWADDKKKRRVRPSITRRNRETLRPLQEFVKGVAVRPMSGPMTKIFPTYDPTEIFTARPCVQREKIREIKTVHVEAVRSFLFSGRDFVLPGQILALSPTEARDAKIITNCKVLA